MTMTCETVKIQADNEQGFIIINKDDHKEQKLFVEKADKPKAAKTKKAE